jgi:diguanylate cyclase (GGDEF)-like protein/PAS domain S-box-containing protein
MPIITRRKKPVSLPVPPTPHPRRPIVPLIAATLALLYVVGRLLPGLGHDGHLAVRWQGAVALYFAAAAMCLLRARRVEKDRLAWTLIGIGIACYALGSIANIISPRPSTDPPPLAFAGWLTFFITFYPALIAMLRKRLRPFALPFLLDGILGGLALATVAAALVAGNLHHIATGELVAGLALPVADLVLLSIILWACAVTGWRGPAWRTLALAMAVMAFGDTVQDIQIARGTYSELSWLTAAFPLAMLGIGAAAWQRAPRAQRMRIDTVAVLSLPLACLAATVVALALTGPDNTIVVVLGLAAMAVAMIRGLLTFGALHRLHETRRFARGFEEAGIGMAFVSVPDLRWRRLNATLAQTLGGTPEDFVGRPIAEIVHPDEADTSRAGLERLRAGEALPAYVRRIVRKDGVVADLEMASVLVEDDDGSPIIFSQIKDVTVERRTARHSAALAELTRVALEQRETGDLIDAVCALLREGVPAADVRLRPAELPLDDTAAPGLTISAPLRPHHGLPALLVATRTPGQPEFIAAHAAFLEAAANVLGTALDRAAIEEELRTQALEDPLTGLANRSYLAAHVEQALAGAQRSEDHISLLLLDLDRFKNVNDTLGHGAGDELLCAVADRLRSTIRRGDLAARLGGDEFVVVCAGAGGAPHEVAALSRRLLDAVSAPYVVDGRELHVSASAGLVFADGGDVTAESLLRDADVAMYRAKEHGGARYEVFDAGLRARVVQRLTVESELRRALERNELSLRVQPVVDLHRDEVAGFEALVRWEHPERGTIAPAEFIGVAEETGLIVPIGRWVLAEALRWLGELQAAAGRPLRMSVNLSGRQIAPELADEVRSALAHAGVPARQLTLEVTETLLVEGAGAVEVLAALRDQGIAIAIDDFGTGWSSLGALQRHPVDVLKLDRSLVAPAGADESAAALARAVVEMAQALGLDVVAEGIEDDAQCAAMRALGCPHGQGYVFSRPVELPAALALIAPVVPTAPAAGARAS